NPKNHREWFRQNPNRKNEKMDQDAQYCSDQPQQRRKRHNLGMIFERRIHEIGLSTLTLIATAWSRALDDFLERIAGSVRNASPARTSRAGFVVSPSELYWNVFQPQVAIFAAS